MCVNGDVASEAIMSTCGVPQGSNIGPLLFITYCYDLPAVIKYANILQYADDTKLLMEISSDFDRTKLQMDINNLAGWCDENGMRINGSKTRFVSFNKRIVDASLMDNIIYHVNLSTIERTEEILDLGILFDNKLTFKPHVATTIAKVNLINGFIRRCRKDFRNRRIRLSLYRTLALPILEYGTTIWCPTTVTEIGMLELLQRQFTRFLLGVPPDLRSTRYITYEQRLKTLDLLKLEERRIIAKICFIVKILNSQSSAPTLNEYLYRNPSARILRSPRHFELPNLSSNFAKKNPMINCQ